MLARRLGVPVQLERRSGGAAGAGAARPRDRARRGARSAPGRAGIGVGDFSLGQPSLDEVFLALTGHPAEEADDHDDARRRTSDA